MADNRTEATAIIAELMQGYHSAERMVDILHAHLTIQYDRAYRAGYSDAWAQNETKLKKKARP
jgi:hypothetical protein